MGLRGIGTCHKRRPLQVLSGADSSPLVNTGTSFSVTLGARSRAIGSGICSSSASHLKNCCSAGTGCWHTRRCTGSADEPATSARRAHLPAPTWSGRWGDQVGGGEPCHRVGVGPHRLGRLASAARCSRNEQISPWKTPASSSLRRRGPGCGTVIVFLSSCGSAKAHTSALKRFRRSEKLRESASPAMRIPLFLRFAQVKGLADATRWSGQGRGRTADLPLFRGSIAP